MSDVDPSLVSEFNVAAVLARMGDHEKSLQAYREIVSRATCEHGLTVSPHFLAVARMRAGFCLMDLERYEDARAEFESMKELVPSLPIGERYEFHFAYGNTLGRLELLGEMYSELIEAVGCAEDMDDYTARPEQCWMNILMHAERAEAWTFLGEKAAIALNNARLRGMERLARFAGGMLDHARRERRALN